MKVLLINGSTRRGQTGYRALSEVEKTLREEGIETEIIELGPGLYYDCIGCNFCQGKGNGHCVRKDDILNSVIDKAKDADGFIISSPVYYSHPSGQLLSFLDRLFYAAGPVLRHKPAAAVVTLRRAGASTSLDVINKYFTDTEMPVVPSTYWAMVHGTNAKEAEGDAEGLQTMRNLARNMAYLLRLRENGKKNGIGPGDSETAAWTNFIR